MSFFLSSIKWPSVLFNLRKKLLWGLEKIYLIWHVSYNKNRGEKERRRKVELQGSRKSLIKIPPSTVEVHYLPSVIRAHFYSFVDILLLFFVVQAWQKYNNIIKNKSYIALIVNRKKYVA